MPSRFTHFTDEKTIKTKFKVKEIDFDLWQSYNIKPTNTVIAIFNDQGERKLEKFYWGRDTPQNVQKARSETILEKSMFAKGFKERRCIMLANGFFEWRKTTDGDRTKSVPFYFKLKNNEPFGAAGLYYEAKEGDEKNRKRMVLLTTSANSIVKAVFHRMPVILTGDGIDDYLDPSSDPDELLGLLKPFNSELMESYEVSDLVSKGDRTDKTIVPKTQLKGALDDFF